MVLTEFHTILLGAESHVHTDHLKITTNFITLDCVIFWRNCIEKFNTCIHFISGKGNTIADTISWLDHIEESVLSEGEQVFVLNDSISKRGDIAGDLLLVECFLHLLPIPIWDTNPMNYQRITKNTDELRKHQQKFPNRYINKVLDDEEIIYYVVPGDDQDMQLRFALSDSMIWPTIHWFHAMLGHLAPIVCMLCCKPDITTSICTCTLKTPL